MSDAREKPIIFSGLMVRAIIDGRKSQTRRVLKPQPIWESEWEGYGEGCWVYTNRNDYCFPMAEYQHPIQPGDRLWVREAFATDGVVVRYAATDDIHELRKTKPSIHMPRWASRITLDVTEVRVQRLQDISEEDARAEGVRGNASGPWGCEGVIEDFSDLWESIHGPGSWDANPWVAAITFKRIKP